MADIDMPYDNRGEVVRAVAMVEPRGGVLSANESIEFPVSSIARCKRATRMPEPLRLPRGKVKKVSPR
ncbi:hypothetical protein D3C85_1246790 [compost metagenome]